MHSILFVRGDEPTQAADAAALPALLADPAVTVWVDIAAPSEAQDLAIVRDVFHFHRLAIEDCFESRDQPKVDEYPDHLYIITHGLTADSTAESASVVELDAFVGARFLVTHHSAPSRSVTAVLEAVTRTALPLRRGPMATLHAILDRQAEGMEEVLDHITDGVNDIEAAIFSRARSNDQLASVLAIKRNILQLRRWMGKQREVVLRLGRREFPIVGETEGMLFRDLYDHLARYTDTLDSFREMLASIQETHLAVISNRLNEVMKFLTMFTTLLMPLTVISGIYGMNFDHMPELRWHYGYPAVLLLMVTVSGGTLLYFRHRGWIGGRGGGRARRARGSVRPGGRAHGARKKRASTTERAGATATVSSTPSRGRS